MGKALLQTQFASVGAYIVTVSMILGGLLLSTDYALGAAAGLGLGEADPRLRPRRVAGGHGLRPKAPASGDPTSTILTPTGDGGEVAVRMSGRPADVRRRADDEEPAKDEEENEDEPDEAAASRGRSKDVRLRAVGISRPKRQEPEQVLEEMDESDVGQTVVRLRAALDGPAAGRRNRQLRRAGEGGPAEGQDPGKDLPRLRLQHPGGGDSNRPGHCPVRGRTGGRPAAEQDHRPGRRSGHRPARAQRADRGAAAGQEHGRHRSAQQRAANRPPPRGDGRGQRQGPEDAHPASTWARTWPAPRWSSI